MSALNRKYNLLSLLRGYDLTHPNDISSILLGYGKGESPSAKYAKQYEKTYSSDGNTVRRAFKFFRKYCDDNSFWYDTEAVIKNLVHLTRYVILSVSPDYKQFSEAMEVYLSRFADSTYYIKRLEEMDSFMNEWHANPEIEDQSQIPGFKALKLKCQKEIKQYLLTTKFYDYTSGHGVTPDDRFIRFIINCLIRTSGTPELFPLNTQKYSFKCTHDIEFDTTMHFSEDLRDTKKKDLYELHGVKPTAIDFEEEEIDSEDEDYEEPPSKKMKGSGFYNWWW